MKQNSKNPFLVEALNKEVNCWYSAEIIDYFRGKVKVKYFDSNIKPNIEEKEVDDIRIIPEKIEFEKNPEINDFVEVNTSVKYHPLGWSIAKIINMKSNYCFVRYDIYNEEFVHIGKLRPHFDNQKINLAGIQREIIDIIPEISTEIKEGISNIREKINPSAINLINNQVIILGDETQVKNCKLLLEALILNIPKKGIDKLKDSVKASATAKKNISLPKNILQYNDFLNKEKLKEIEGKYGITISIIEDKENIKIQVEGNDELRINELFENVIPKDEEYIISKEDFQVIDSQSLDIITSAKNVSHLIDIIVNDSDDGVKKCHLIGNQYSINQFKLELNRLVSNAKQEYLIKQQNPSKIPYYQDQKVKNFQKLNNLKAQKNKGGIYYVKKS